MIQHRQIPNILVILTDQQRWDAVGYTTPWVQTPHLTALSKRSIVCTTAITQSPQCQPSRVSLFTGRYPTAHRVWWNNIKVPTTELTLGNYLGMAGYATGYFGKLHFHGSGTHTAVATQFGFATTYLFEDWAQAFRVVYETGAGKIKSSIETEFQAPMTNKTWTGQLQHRQLHHEEVITDKAIEFIREARQPYCCVVGYHGPHPPYAAPIEFSRLYEKSDFTIPTETVPNLVGHALTAAEWRQLKIQYYGAVSWLDACVGRLLQSVDTNTIIVYTSDHGDILGDHGLFSKGLFAYEGTVRVPLLLAIPTLRPGVYPYLVQLIDMVPTLLELCGISVPIGIQGRSLVRAFHQRQLVNTVAVSMIGHRPRLRMLRTLRYKYWLVRNQEVVFDLETDPGETTNLVNRPSLLADLRFQLVKALIRCEDPLPTP